MALAVGWAHGVVVAVTAATTVCAVLGHYEGLTALGRHVVSARRRRSGHPPQRRTVLKVVAGLFALHVAEIWLFGLAYWGLLSFVPAGRIEGTDPHSLLDAVYLSAMTFTTVGFGDLAPVGPIRFMAGTEALTGLMLITWSASFTFLEMSRHWRDDRGDA